VKEYQLLCDSRVLMEIVPKKENETRLSNVFAFLA